MATRTESEFINLPFHEKLDFLYGLPARRKLDLILSAPEAERLVQSFTPESLFYTLKEIGSADAGDLLSMAIPEQVKGLVDLDCWDKDRPNLARMREWIEAMAEGGRKRIADALVNLDLELVTLFIRQFIKVHRLDETEAALDLASSSVVQFDEHYVIEFTGADSLAQLVQEFLEEVFERDYNYYASLLEEIYCGVDAELEEQAFALRRARLSDRGFPDYFDAQNVFTYLDPHRFREIRTQHVAPNRDDLPIGGDQSSIDVALTAPGGDDSLFNAALMAGFAMQGKRQLRSEMAMVTNQVLVARSIDFGDPEAVRTAVEMTHHYLNLGLENLAGGDLHTAIDDLRDTHLKLLFRLGISLTIDLRTRAQESLKRLGLSAERSTELPYLDSPYAEGLAGFLQRLPRFHAALDRGGSVELRDFSSMRDLHLGYALLDQIDAVPGVFRGLLGLEVAAPAFRAAVAGRDIKLSQILLTALVNLALDRRLTPAPIAASRLGAVRALLTESVPARLGDGFRDLVARTLEARLAPEMRRHGADFVNSCLNVFEEEYAELEAGRPIDPRFVRSLLLRQD